MVLIRPPSRLWSHRRGELGICVRMGCSRKRLTNYAVDDVGIGDGVFRLAQAAGVSSAVWLIVRSANPDKIEIK